MKKLLFLALAVILGHSIFAQQPAAIAVAGFEVMGGVTADEAAVTTELFTAQLVSGGVFRVVDRGSFDKIIAEMQFQASDWSDSAKTAALGKALNAQLVARGRLMKLGAVIYWTGLVIDVNTAQALYSARLDLKDMGEVFAKTPAFCAQLLDAKKKLDARGAYALQLPTAAVATFDVIGGITPEESAIVTELFMAALVESGRVNVADRGSLDRIAAEQRFQASDWSDSAKTAELGKALNAQVVVRGQLMKMGQAIYWTSTMIDVNTAEALYSARQELKDLGEVYGKLPDFCRQMVAKVPLPNYFVGRWQSTGSYDSKNYVCIVEFKADGTVIVERRDYIEEIFQWKSGFLSEGSWVVQGRTSYRSNSNGTYTLETEGNEIKAATSLNRDIYGYATIASSEPDRMRWGVRFVRRETRRDGRTDTEWYWQYEHRTFTRIK